MPSLIVNVPAVNVWVRKEYLRDHIDGHGEFVKGIWISIKSIPGRALYFETYLPDYGALYDKLPISAFIARGNDSEIPTLPKPDMSLVDLQFWNCMDYQVTVLEKFFISSMDVEVRTRNHGVQYGTYLFTLDNYHGDNNIADCSVSEIPQEHKSFNVIEMENTQYCVYPNNRLRFLDVSLTPDKPLIPDFKVSTKYYQVENDTGYRRLGDTDEYFWQNTVEEFDR
jgi:hypothetical protein